MTFKEYYVNSTKQKVGLIKKYILFTAHIHSFKFAACFGESNASQASHATLGTIGGEVRSYSQKLSYIEIIDGSISSCGIVQFPAIGESRIREKWESQAENWFGGKRDDSYALHTERFWNNVMF